ncbi:MAG: DNA replication/repair protein RecF [Treponema sp.]|nr:DNA replication/repair protein RecF [Treponema sp.]
MPFLSLSPVNYRNLINKPIDLLAKEVYFTGENGQGKSNLLEALYCSSYGSSFRTRADSELIKNGEESMSLRTIYREENGNVHTTSVVLEKGQKKIEKDGKIIHDRKELINTMPCVLYSHDDLDFAEGSPERRRFFIDQSLSMYDVMYIDVMRRYKRILKNRNICLKERKFELFDTYDIQLIMNGLEIQKKRKDAVFQFNQIFEKMYENISGISGVNIRYLPSWKNPDEVSLPNIDEIMETVKSKREIERALGTTVTGPHRDKIVFEKNGGPFVPKASTGQRRLIALILRTAQAVFYTQVTSKKPVLLMDDVMLELDPEKRRKLTALLPDYDQLFCTFLPGEPYENYMHESTRVYKIEKGAWTECK